MVLANCHIASPHNWEKAMKMHPVSPVVPLASTMTGTEMLVLHAHCDVDKWPSSSRQPGLCPSLTEQTALKDKPLLCPA